MIQKYKINWKMTRLLIILILPFIFVYWVKNLAEFSYPLNVNGLYNPSWQDNQPINIGLNNDFFKAITKIDLPFLYKVYARNDVFFFISATNVKNSPSTTTVILDNKIDIPYQGIKKISDRPIYLRNDNDVKNYLKSRTINIIPNYNGEILVGPSQIFSLGLDGLHKYIIFDFKLRLDSIFILYLIALITIYPFLLLPLSYLLKFILKGEPFCEKII